jgi:hypothetical protein
MKIKSITKKHINNERLYNLAVMDDETFVADGIVVHNCRSIIRYVTRIDVQEDRIVPSEPISGNEMETLKKKAGSFISG